jgi:3-phosphoshikimate 1-carboxyvinyltransferase
MDITIHPSPLRGTVTAIPSKSQAHRLLICAAFADAPTTLLCPETNRDIEATADCLRSLGAEILRTEQGYLIHPISNIPESATLHCSESGSTLRFLLPIVGALGVDGTFRMEGRLPQRPLSPLWEEMERMGCQLSRPTENTLRCQGKLHSGNYRIRGDVSSQFITGLLLALSRVSGSSTVEVLGTLESKPYVDMTLQAMKIFEVDCKNFQICGSQTFHSPGTVIVEGDWSNAAFFLAAGALGSQIQMLGLDLKSAQGDKAVFHLLSDLEQQTTISAKDIPDLIPILSVIAAAKRGAVFTDIARLRLKESDRIASTIAMLKALGGKAEATDNTLTVYPSDFTGGMVDPMNDHRIAMSAAIAAIVCKEDVTIRNAECVSKSYPKFFEEYRRLGGNYEQYLR